METRVATMTIAVSITLRAQKHKTDFTCLTSNTAKMDYHQMTLPELKALAKDHEPKIKHYYIMPRALLIEILMKDKLDKKMIIEKKTLKQLQAEAKEKGIPRVWKFRRAELVEILYPSNTHSVPPTEKKE